MGDDINENDILNVKDIKFVETPSSLTFNVEKPGKMYFKINGKIKWVFGDSKWEMIKRWFGKMNDG